MENTSSVVGYSLPLQKEKGLGSEESYNSQ